MMKASEPRIRYQTDPTFKSVVDLCAAMLAKGDIDIASLIQAAVLGAQLYAERYGAPIVVRIEDRRVEGDPSV